MACRRVEVCAMQRGYCYGTRPRYRLKHYHFACQETQIKVLRGDAWWLQHSAAIHTLKKHLDLRLLRWKLQWLRSKVCQPLWSCRSLMCAESGACQVTRPTCANCSWQLQTQRQRMCVWKLKPKVTLLPRWGKHVNLFLLSKWWFRSTVFFQHGLMPNIAKLIWTSPVLPLTNAEQTSMWWPLCLTAEWRASHLYICCCARMVCLQRMWCRRVGKLQIWLEVSRPPVMISNSAVLEKLGLKDIAATLGDFPRNVLDVDLAF